MAQHISQLSLLVRDYDEAIAFYTQKLGFTLLEDTPLNEEKRWVRVGSTAGGFNLLLAKAATNEQLQHVGNQSGGRVFLFLETDSFAENYQAMKSRGVTFLEKPREEPYGTVAVFVDLYGNKWDLIEPRDT